MAATQAPDPGLIGRLRLALERIGLPAWFVIIDLLWIAKPDALAIDARHYQRAATAWLNGGDPWRVTEGGVGFAAGPHTLLFYAPTSTLSIEASAVAWTVLGLVASAWLVRRLGLPLWWLTFPPLAQAAWNGNPQTIVLALLVAGSTAPAVVAVALKLYAAVVLILRPRDLVIAAIVLAVTLPFLPWQQYVDDRGVIAASLATTWNGSAWRFPVLLLPTVLALWVLRRRGAEWLAIPAAWPATEFYFTAMALPALVGRPLLAAAFALPVPMLVPVAVMVLAAQELRRDRSVLRPSVAPLRT